MATEKEKNGDDDGRSARRWRQYLAAVVVNIAGFISGTAYGWTAPILPVLQSENSPVGIPPITEVDASWLASIINLTRIVATPAFMYVNDRYGRKITGYAIAALSILSWAMMLYANSVTMIFSARVIIGISSGGIVLLVPAFTSDFAEDDIKGRLAAIFGLSMNLGATFSYAAGNYASYPVYHASCLLVPVLFAACFFRLPESPLFLMTAGRTKEAEDSLRWYRAGQDCDLELERVRARASEALDKRNRKVALSGVFDKPTLRALLITMGLLTNKQLGGATVVTTFTVSIFQQSGSAMSPGLSTVAIGLLLVFGTLASALVVERFGRRPLLLYTDLFIGACLAALGTFLYLKDAGRVSGSLGWIPLACLSGYILGLSLALGPMTFTVATEMVAASAKGPVQTVCSVYGALVAFASAFSYAPLARAAGQHGAFWLFSAVCLVGSAGVFLTMPETKGRSAEDVVEQLRGDRYVRSVLRGPPRKSTSDARSVPHVL
ncbi:facilitated trehalose transporter Tret1-like [Bacillus rossius redtenbacheri]|uniref:facilitated trehalose transporter Tret1-like n=1 Tax=Bacillus rossius redtenbacheri TaxID=93214 RepID=UPI002FDD52D8